jgi:hypothetical protein
MGIPRTMHEKKQEEQDDVLLDPLRVHLLARSDGHRSASWNLMIHRIEMNHELPTLFKDAALTE